MAHAPPCDCIFCGVCFYPLRKQRGYMRWVGQLVRGSEGARLASFCKGRDWAGKEQCARQQEEVSNEPRANNKAGRAARSAVSRLLDSACYDHSARCKATRWGLNISVYLGMCITTFLKRTKLFWKLGIFSDNNHNCNNWDNFNNSIQHDRALIYLTLPGGVST